MGWLSGKTSTPKKKYIAQSYGDSFTLSLSGGSWQKQFLNLSSRISILRWTIMFAAFGFLFNMLTVFALYLDELFVARVIFGSCCLSMIISIAFFIREIQISTNALNLHMSDMDVKID